MKSTPQDRLSRRRATATATQPQASDLVPLTGATIADSTIRDLLREARSEGRTALAVTCCKALVHPATCTTVSAVTQRKRARHECADTVNSHARHWLEHGMPAQYRKYVQLLLAGTNENPTDRADTEPPRRKQRKRTLKYKLCWYCNDRFEFGDYTQTRTESGVVTVHHACAAFMASEGLTIASNTDDTLDADPSDE